MLEISTDTNSDAAAVLVTVAAISGSTPREAGAKMLITATGQSGTIGGGHLEQKAADIAREMLRNAGMGEQNSKKNPIHSSKQTPNHVERFALGPSLGQCCGGVVHLAFETMDAGQHTLLNTMRQRHQNQQDSWRIAALDGASAVALLDADGQYLIDLPGLPEPGDAALPTDFDRQRGCHVLQDGSGRRWLIDPSLAYRQQIVLFGAGHVGAALVYAMAHLPCRITWVDERAEQFPADLKNALPANVQIELTDIPESVVDAAAAGSYFLVMTHSHALDQRLAEAILRRNDSAWFGLIGSHTKQKQFEHRLQERGFSAGQIAQMHCPIGLPGIDSKLPAVIAASVSAQLMQLWQLRQLRQQPQEVR